MAEIEIDTLLIEQCKEYMHAEGESSARIVPFIRAAADYLAIDVTGSLTQLEILAIFSLTLYYYDHRDDVDGTQDMPIGLRPIINKLKWGRPAATQESTQTSEGH